ncbi:MAG: DUF2461 domain-containing protein [Hyphomicrobiales bacterium]|nr:DUF2461 domain-containing protein [Hyphomicrobiales bacterium]
MNGFSAETLAFLETLRGNNNRDWFEGHRETYVRVIRDASRSFAESLSAALEAKTGDSHRYKVYRVNRDVRFSKDKSPYNAHVHMAFWPDNSGPTEAVWMLGLEPGKLTFGAGIMAFSASQLDAWRKRVAGADGAALSDCLSVLVKQGARLSEPELKRVPAPFEKGHSRADLLRRKSMTVWRDTDDVEICFGSDGPQRCLPELLTFVPITEWLRDI